MALIVILYKVVLIFKSASEICRRNPSNRKSLAKYSSVVL